MSADEIENPDNLLYGHFDLAFVLIYLFPLLILALSYNVLSAEREQGTLALTLSQPVRLATLVLGKLTSRAIVLIPLAVGLSVVAAQASGGTPFSMEFVLRIAIILAYATFWFSLAVVVNAAGKSSAANAVAVCVCWVAFTPIVPSAPHMAAGTLYPVPSRVEMIRAMRESSKEAAPRGSVLLARYLVRSSGTEPRRRHRGPRRRIARACRSTGNRPADGARSRTLRQPVARPAHTLGPFSFSLSRSARSGRDERLGGLRNGTL